jgi:hypothetical protein
VNMLTCTEYTKNTEKAVNESVFMNTAFAMPVRRGCSLVVQRAVTIMSSIKYGINDLTCAINFS